MALQQPASMRYRTFLASLPVKAYKKGEIVIFQGEVPRSAYIIKSGGVKAYNLSSAGDEKPLGLFGEYSVFPGAWVFGQAPSAIYYYEALSDCELYCVSPYEYLATLKQDSTAMFDELQNYIADDIGKTMRLNALQHSRASDKLIYTLHYLALSHGRPLDHNLVEINLALTHQDFANLTGLTRETTATELSRLKTQRVISYGKQTPYRVDMRRLRDVLTDQFIAELRLAP